MIRVLHVFGGLGNGGTESLIMNWYRNIDRSKIQFDFLVRSPDRNYTEEIEELGGRVFYTASFPGHFVRNYRQTKAILERKEWEIIHVHGNAAMYMLPLKLAKKLGYRCRVMHSHSVKTQNPVFTLVHKHNRRKIGRYATCCLACSDAAGKWMYPNTEFAVLHNAVQTEKFLFDQNARTGMRKKLGIDDCLVLGHVGRFSLPKNHAFLLDVFFEVKKRQPDSVLMLVGNGALEAKVREKVQQLELVDSVLFIGKQTNIGRWLSAMDMFVLPSLYEGLAIALVEAQCNGIPCVVSQEAYNEEVNIYADKLSVLPLSCGAEVWAEQILKKMAGTMNRGVDTAIMQDRGYDMKTEIAKLEEIYCQAVRGQ